MNEISNVLVCFLGIGAVFAGLVAIIILCRISSMVICFFERKDSETSESQFVAEEDDGRAGEEDSKYLPLTENRQEILAAVSAAIAEYQGIDVSRIRVRKFVLSEDNDRQQILAAVSAAIAEHIGREISGIRILSFKQV